MKRRAGSERIYVRVPHDFWLTQGALASRELAPTLGRIHVNGVQGSWVIRWHTARLREGEGARLWSCGGRAWLCGPGG